jgi:hypothetical protein
VAAIGNRNLFGDPNQYDNGLRPASYVDGQDDSLSQRPPYTAPTSVTDQTSDETRPEREALQGAYQSAQRAASRIAADAGAGGTVVAPAGQFEQLGQIAPDGGVGQIIAANRLVTRSDGADSGDTGAGKAIG